MFIYLASNHIRTMICVRRTVLFIRLIPISQSLRSILRLLLLNILFVSWINNYTTSEGGMMAMVWTTARSRQELLKVHFGHKNVNHKIFSMARIHKKIFWWDARSTQQAPHLNWGILSTVSLQSAPRVLQSCLWTGLTSVCIPRNRQSTWWSKVKHHGEKYMLLGWRQRIPQQTKSMPIQGLYQQRQGKQ